MGTNRLQREKEVVATMIRLYCARHHGGKGKICEPCADLLRYAHERIDRCPQGVHKSFCSRCVVHCYAPAMRQQIRTVMRFSGPRMLWHHPMMAVSHLAYSWRR